MRRWLFLFLAVVLAGFSPANARALTQASQAAYDDKPSVEIIVFVVGITRDTYQGRTGQPASLHLYLYCYDNPINAIDPSGHEDLAGLCVSEEAFGGQNS
ncbi:MAG TPA: hypothetical protein VN829_23560, partial [Dongiaceae bacterium]|nr:hypothetical protein [Dongiaceae bacterium]